jgi:hypothetical protein
VFYITGKTSPLRERYWRGTADTSEHNLKEAAEREIRVVRKPQFPNKSIEALIPDQPFRKGDEHFAGRPEHGGKRRFDVAYEGRETAIGVRPAGAFLQRAGRLKRNSGEKYQGKAGIVRIALAPYGNGA